MWRKSRRFLRPWTWSAAIIEQLPIQDMIGTAMNTLNNVDRLLSSPDLTEALAALAGGMREFETTMAAARTTFTTGSETLTEVQGELRTTMADLQNLIGTANREAGPLIESLRSDRQKRRAGCRPSQHGVEQHQRSGVPQRADTVGSGNLDAEPVAGVALAPQLRRDAGTQSQRPAAGEMIHMTGFRWGLLLLIPLVTGCAETLPPPNLHVLSSLPRDAASGPGSAAASRGPVVGVEQANIPEYLDRPEIVVRTSANTLELTQGDRWGQRLQGDITRVVAENLRGLLPSDNVFVLPLRRREPVAMTVAVDITSFERDASGNAVLNAYWSVLDGQTEAERAGARARYSEPVEGEGVEATVAAMNRTLAALSRDIAAGIKQASSSRRQP